MTEAPADAAAQPTRWQEATVVDVRRVTSRLVSLRLTVPDRLPQLAGQHYVVRLTAEDGYTAQRSYSVASAPSDDLLELCVERLEDGEVSGYLYDVVEPGDVLDVRGPIGGWFVWDTVTPALAIGGGTGVVPLRSMMRAAAAADTADRLALAVSGRTPDELPYADEFVAAGATVALTGRDLPPGPALTGRAPGRLADDDLAALMRPEQTFYVCGSAGFAEAMTQSLLRCGADADRIRVERFGPTS